MLFFVIQLIEGPLQIIRTFGFLRGPSSGLMWAEYGNSVQ